eukprot:10324423-Alexandrium_andersonii.AAC.1
MRGPEGEPWVGGRVVAPVSAGLRAALARYAFESQQYVVAEISWVEPLMDFRLTSGAGKFLPVDHAQRP